MRKHIKPFHIQIKLQSLMVNNILVIGVIIENGESFFCC